METLTDKLKLLTREKHQKTENSLLVFIKSIRSVQDYLPLLQIFYGFFGALEEKIDLYVDDQILPDYLKRRKSAVLKEDILSLGGKPQKAQSRFLTEITNLDEALGAMYVMEGSTLGGRYIVMMIIKTVPHLAPHLRFFHGYNDKTELMWDQFKMRLNKMSDDPARWAQTISTAGKTFDNFHDYIHQEINPGK